MTWRALLATHRQLFLLLVGLGLLARVLVPVGWMPHVSNGDVRLVLCGGFAPVAAPALDHHSSQATSAHGGHEPAPADDRQAQMAAPCPFTLASASALLIGAGAAIAALMQVAVEPVALSATVPPTPRLAAPPPPAIGPPTT